LQQEITTEPDETTIEQGELVDEIPDEHEIMVQAAIIQQGVIVEVIEVVVLSDLRQKIPM